MSRANEIAMHYLGGLRDAMRKKNTATLKGRGSIEAVEPDAMGDDAEMGDDDLASVLEDASSAENEMGDDFAGDGKDAGSEEMRAAGMDQATMGKDPMSRMSGEKKPTASVDQMTEDRDPTDPVWKKKQNFRSKA